MRTPEIDAAIQKTLSNERLEKYLQNHSGDLAAAISLYELNTRLSEAFYTPLQTLEVCFRNRMNDKLVDSYGSDWFRPGKAPLKQSAITDIVEAVEKLNGDRKTVTLGAVVAELRFAFWVSLIGATYDESLWRKSICNVFIDENGKRMARAKVHSRLNVIRRFRNRVAHHEPIFQKDLASVHAEILETIEWMCPSTAAWAGHNSRLPSMIER